VNRTALVFATAAVVGTLGLKRYPFPDSNVMLQLVHFHKPWIFHALRWGWFTMLFSTPALLFSGIFSLVFIFTANKKKHASKCELPPYPRLGPADAARGLTRPDRAKDSGAGEQPPIRNAEPSGVFHFNRFPRIVDLADHDTKRIRWTEARVRG